MVTEELWCRRRYKLVDELISADLVDHIDQLPLEGSGFERYVGSLHLMHDAFSDYHEQAEFVVADGERAVGYARITGTHDGDLMGIPPTGRKIDIRSIGILRFDHGQVVERWGIGDTLTQMQQLGLLG